MSRGTRRAVQATVRRTARLVVNMMYRIEEHVSDPSERWALLKKALSQIGQEKPSRSAGPTR